MTRTVPVTYHMSNGDEFTYDMTAEDLNAAVRHFGTTKGCIMYADRVINYAQVCHMSYPRGSFVVR
jgi:hypothetical protein